MYACICIVFSIHHFPEFQHNILPLSTTQEHLTSHNVGCIIPPTDQNLRNTTNNNLTRPSCYYVNYKQHCNEVRSQVVSSVSSSTTSTSWSCTAPNMSTPQKYLNQKKYGSISPQGVRKINSYHAYQYNQLFPGFECPVYATETNNNENIDVTPASGSAKCQNTFNNCHFHGPVTFWLFLCCTICSCVIIFLSTLMDLVNVMYYFTITVKWHTM